MKAKAVSKVRQVSVQSSAIKDQVGPGWQMDCKGTLVMTEGAHIMDSGNAVLPISMAGEM